VEVVVHSKRQILRNFAGYLPIVLFAGFFYFAVGFAGMVWLLDGSLEDALVKPVAAAVTASIVIVGGLLYVRFVVNDLSRSHIKLEGDAVIIRGQTSAGLVERRYAVEELEAIVFGERLNVAERLMDKLHKLGVPRTGSMRLLKDLKAGRMLVTDKAGGQEVFHFVDKVFDLDSLLAFAAELSRRGVAIGGSS
jgi:hypothetical protein